MIIRNSRSLLCTALLFGALVISGAFTNELVAQITKIDINLNHKHSVGGIDSLDRAKYINVHSDVTETDWDMGVNEVGDLRDHFLNGYNVYMGRNTGGISWQINNNTDEDSGRPGYADSVDVKTSGATAITNYSNNTNWQSYEHRNGQIIAAQLHPFFPDGQLTNKGWAFSQENAGTDQFGFATGEYMGRYIRDFYGGEGQPHPNWIQVINEPMWHLWDQQGEYTPTEIFQFHNGAAQGIRSILGDQLPIGGYTTAFPNFEEQNFDRWRNRWKLFMDMSGSHMDFWTIHLYDFPEFGGKQILRKGSNIEATLDMMEQYSQISQGEVKPILISEYGAQTHDSRGDLWTPYRDWLKTKSVSSMMMTFMERPQVISKAVPFIVLKAEWGRVDGVPYTSRLMRQAFEGEGETGSQWVYSDQVLFYELWSEVKGKRVDTKSLDLDFQTDAYIDDNTLYLIVNNLEWEDKQFLPQLFDNHSSTLNSIDVKHLHLVGDAGQVSTYQLTGPDMSSAIDIGAEGTVVLKYNFGSSVVLDETKDETKYYAENYLNEITGGEDITININNVTTATHGEAMLRLGIGRDHGKSIRPRVKINDQDIEVPFNYRGDDQANRETFYGVIEIPVPYDYLQVNNEIKVSFTDDGGYVASASMRVFNYSSMPSRSPGDPVTGVTIDPMSKILLIGSTFQLNETIQPATAENIKVTWSSDNTAAATVDEYGLVTAIAKGTANIKVTTDDGGHTATSAIEVTDQLPNIVSCDLLPNNGIESLQSYSFDIPFSSNEDQKIFVDVRKVVNGTPVAQWHGGSETIVGVEAGTLTTDVFMQTIQVPGDSVRIAVWIQPIDGTWQDATDACNVFTKVLGKVDVTSVEILSDLDSLDMGETEVITTLVLPADATNSKLTWTSDDTSIATVSSAGLVTAILPGEVKITATSQDVVTFSDDIMITIVDTTDIISSIPDNIQKISIYPNPTEGKIKISGANNNEVTVSIADQSGRILLLKRYARDEEIDISILGKGVYLLKIWDGQSEIYHKLIKE